MSTTKSTTKAAKPKGQTLRVSRVIRAPRERVYKAFVDADAFAKWIPPDGYVAHVYQHEARVGGSYRMSFASMDGKDKAVFGGKFLELTPPERIRYTDKFESDHPDMQGEIQVTVTFKEVPGGTEVVVVQEGLPPVIPMESAQKGWAQSFDNLARLCEYDVKRP